jgi:hypothetical protein
MYHLSQDERLALVQFVHREVAGRVCLVASGTFEDAGTGAERPSEESADGLSGAMILSILLFLLLHFSGLFDLNSSDLISVVILFFSCCRRLRFGGRDCLAASAC